MGTPSPVVDMANLSLFSPLDQLAPSQVELLLARSRIERLPPGKRLFDIGDSDGRSIFLLAGQLALVSADNRIRMLKAATPEAGEAIAHCQPREATALARTAATVLCVDNELLESLLRPEASVPADVDPEVANDPDLGPIFASPLFARLPGPCLRTLMERMDTLETRAGDVVLREGDDGDWYFIVESGRIRLTRQGRGKGSSVLLAELGRLDGFGESALIADERQDFTVTALDRGRLLRFARADFLNLIVKPYIRWITHGDLAALMLKGAALLDIRSHKAYARHHLHDSINLPLRVLREVSGLLDRERRYVITSDGARRSAAAAFLLARQGIETMILKNEVTRSAHGADADGTSP